MPIGSFQDEVRRGVELQRMGRPAEAEAIYRHVLAVDPRNAEALNFLGIALESQGRWTDAAASFSLLIDLAPDHAVGHFGLGRVLEKLGRADESLASYDRALALASGMVEIHFHRGRLLCTAMNRPADALPGLDILLARNTDFALGYSYRGAALRSLGRYEAALADFNRAVLRMPQSVELRTNRGMVLIDMNRIAEALADFDRVLADQPEYVPAMHCRAIVLRDMGRIDEALAMFHRLVAIRPDYAEALFNYAKLEWLEKNDLASAIRHLEQAVAVNQDLPYAAGFLLHLKMMACDWRDFSPQVALIDHGVRAGKPVIEPFVYQTVSLSSENLLMCARAFGHDLFPERARLPFLARPEHKRIRLGYLSADFREHATAHLMAELFELHDRRKFEVVAIDYTRIDASAMRRRLAAAFDRIIDIRVLPDAVAAQMIADAGIDILVNINGYASEKRMGVSALRPAPLQVNYLGFPGTLGVDYIDYILADRIVLPEGEQRYFTEQVVWLPHCYQVNDRKRMIAAPPTRAECGLPETDFVFCNVNSAHKITPVSFAVWMRILSAVPGSVLWLLESHAQATENLRREAAARGVAPERLIFAPRVLPDRHLARLSLADLFLDLGPYTAHTTASDALWAGLPLLTLRGTAFAGRVAASLLAAVEMPELVAESIEEYEARALQLAREPERLQALRRKLASNRHTAPLFDTPRFISAIEAAYAGMWEQFLTGKAPQGFAIPR